jgi:hypothetical protein
MWPVVSKDHLSMLKEALSCTAFGIVPTAPERKPVYGSN